MSITTRNALGAIRTERERQIADEGWTPEHDDTHDDGQLAKAAAAYIYAADQAEQHDFVPDCPTGIWPWALEWWKPSADPRRNLEKAGALIVAEMERLERKTNGLHADAQGEIDAAKTGSI